MYRYIEAQRFDQKSAITLFEDSADIDVKEEKCMSFEKFVIVSVD